MSIRDIIESALDQIKDESQISRDKIDALLEKAEVIDALAMKIKEGAEDLVTKANSDVDIDLSDIQPFESDMNFRSRIEDYEGNSDALIGEGGALRDTGTYWWRGLPIEAEVSWLDGIFTLTVFKQATGKRCGRYSIKLSKLLAYIECGHDENLKSALGSDYDRMFSDCVDRHDTSNPES